MNVPSIRPDVLHRALQRRGKPNLVDSFAASKTALIVVDMQNYFMEPGAAVEVPGARAIVPAINRLADAARTAGSPVVSAVSALGPFSDFASTVICACEPLGTTAARRGRLEGVWRVYSRLGASFRKASCCGSPQSSGRSPCSRPSPRL